MESAEANAALVENHTRRCDYLSMAANSASSVQQIVTARRGDDARKNGRQLAGRSDVMHARISLVGDGPRNTSGVGSHKRQGDKGKFMRSEYNEIVCTACGAKHDNNSCQLKQYVCRVNNYSLHTKSLKKFVQYVVDVQVSGIVLSIEKDTGSAIACVSYDCYKNYSLQCELQKQFVSLFT